MNMTSPLDIRRIVVILPLLVLIACGGGGSAGGGVVGNGGGNSLGPDYFPLSINDRQLYRSPQDGEFETRVMGSETIGGRAATRLQNTYVVSGLTYDEYIIRDASGVRRIPGPNADPIELAMGDLQVLRFPVSVGDRFTQISRTLGGNIDLNGDGRADSITVNGTVDVVALEMVNTPMGALADCARVRTLQIFDIVLGGNGQSARVVFARDEWFAPGVGLVRREDRASSGTLEEVYSQSITAYAVGGRSSETVPPFASSPQPASGSLNGPAAQITVDFSEWMDFESFTTVSAQVTTDSGATISGRWQLVDRRARFTPSAGLPSGQITVVLTTGVRDFAGNGLAQEMSWQFMVDATGPQLLSRSPAPGATGVPGQPTITATFTEQLDIASAVNGMKLYRGTVQVPAAVSYEGATIRLVPSQTLERDAEHRVVIEASVADSLGNPTGQRVEWTFRTMPAVLADARPMPFVSPVEAVAVGDVTGDGRPDVVVTTFFGFTSDDLRLFVLPQQPDGSLGTRVEYPTLMTYGCRASSIALGDVNGDGRTDVVLAEFGCGIEILLQTPAGTLAPGGFMPTTDSYKVRLADLDGDGRLDLVSLGWGTNQVQVRRGTASGLATAPETYAVEHFGYDDLAVGDVNGDGRPDIVITSGQGNLGKSLAILRQRGDQMFGDPEYREVDPIWGAWGVDIGDIDGDGRNDIVASFNGNSPTFIGVFLQRADGQLAPIQRLPSFDMPTGIKIADMNGDGRADIVVAHRGWASVGVYLQRTDGTLAEEDRYLAAVNGFNPDVLDVGDVNGDGRPDVVAEASVLLGKASTASTSTVLGRPMRALRGAATALRR